MLKTQSLTPNAKSIILDKETETPFFDKCPNLNKDGTYLCRNCGIALFKHEYKFSTNCGWPSFGQELPGSVKKLLDDDKIRTEEV